MTAPLTVSGTFELLAGLLIEVGDAHAVEGAGVVVCRCRSWRRFSVPGSVFTVTSRVLAVPSRSIFTGTV